jgi:hypothetical protein
VNRFGPIWQDRTTLEIRECQPGLVPQLVHEGEIWATAGYGIYCRRRGAAWSLAGRVPSRIWQRGAYPIRWVFQGLRLGIHRLLRLESGEFLAVVTGRLLRSEDGGRTFSIAHEFHGFRRPARAGLLRDDRGRVFISQYLLNRDRSRPVSIWRSEDRGRSFDEVFRFPPGAVRHIHFLQQDPVDGSIWMGTGDADSESGIFRSRDGGESFEEIGRGGQRWRAVAVAFRPEAVFWGTDAGSDAGSFRNRIVRWDRDSAELEELTFLQGPVHGITRTTGDGILLSTGVEGGMNEVDDRVHLWHSADGSTWREIAAWQKGYQPRRVQYAVAHFMPEQDEAEDTYVILRGIRGCAVGHLVIRLLSKEVSGGHL